MNKYDPPAFLFNGHLQTIYPTLFRKFDTSFYTRERIDTQDGDFIDLDWSKVGSKKLVIISHGLEGSSHRSYVVGMVKAANSISWDALAWNFRSCSGETNKKLQSYHNGSTDDLAFVIDYAAKRKSYDEIALVGFSMGGNVTLLHLGAEAKKVNSFVSKAVAFSVPMHLDSSSLTLARSSNKIYMKRFLKKLHKKIKVKMDMFPGQIDDNGYNDIKSFHHFDDRYTAPIHGFEDAKDYYNKCSSVFHLNKIEVPTLIVNAGNDPFLSDECYPIKKCEENRNLTLKIPQHGGHVGFPILGNDYYWSELRVIKFLQN
jgi:predicted alpha/beta-fold hydrolase